MEVTVVTTEVGTPTVVVGRTALLQRLAMPGISVNPLKQGFCLQWGPAAAETPAKSGESTKAVWSFIIATKNTYRSGQLQEKSTSNRFKTADTQQEKKGDTGPTASPLIARGRVLRLL